MFSVHKFEISERNMYVRRFLPTYFLGRSLPAKDINRYRNRIAVAHPLAVKGRIWKPFASYEAFYDFRRDLCQSDGPKTESGPASRCPSTSTCRFSRPTCGKALRELKTSTT